MSPPPGIGQNGERVARWLVLAHLPGIGSRERIELLEHFGSLDAVFDTPRGLLERRLPGNAAAVDALLSGTVLQRESATLEWFDEPNRHLVTWQDSDYPPMLREIADPPLVLYVAGRRELLARAQVAIVGSRNPTPQGKENAYAFGLALAQAGLTITSGMALGVDGAAHRGALDAGAGTIAVCGTGLDRVYPAAHRDLAHAIAQEGALVSEFPLGTPPRRENFPIRNRVIAGLSLGTLVVEAALKSGSLITARLAGESGREVFAIPGSIHSPQARGCHRLIRQGAKLVETAQDVIEELGALAEGLVHMGNPTSAASEGPELREDQSRILDCLGHEPASIDQLVERSGLTASGVSSILLELELRGMVHTMTGGLYQRIFRNNIGFSGSRNRAGE